MTGTDLPEWLALLGPLYPGSSKSNKRVVFYNKSDELKSKPNYYLTNLFNNYLDKKKDVFRVEVRLKSKEFKKYSNYDDKTKITKTEIDIFRLNDKSYILNIFMNYWKKLIDIRKINNNNISRCEKVSIIDFRTTELIINVEYRDRVEDDFKRERNYIKHLLNEYFISRNENTYNDLLFFYERFIKNKPIVNEWYMNYIKKNNIYVKPPI